MPRIRITTLTDKMKDEQVLSKLKSIGAKTKDKEKAGAEEAHEDAKEKLSASGEKIVEKRVASTVIRRRVQPPPPPPPEPVVEKIIEEAKPVEEAAVTKPTTKRRAPSKKALAEAAAAEPAQVVTEAAPSPAAETVSVPTREAEEKLVREAGAAEPARPTEGIAKEEQAKPEVETIGEEKKQEITRALEEVYKQDLEKEFKLVEEEPEEEKKRKKAERLLKKIEEEELEATTTKKKGLLKRKVVIREEDLYAFRRRGGKTLPFRKTRGGRAEARAEDEARPELRIVRKAVKIADQIQVGELAKRLSVKAQDVIARLLSLGTISNINQSIDYETASLVAQDLGFEVERVFSMEEQFQARETEARESEEKEQLKGRPPVVTIMGHVDHGKTLLLDTIRNTNVAEHEAGGITQHIGAYLARVHDKEIAFLDTPGHEAFTAMRARGALVTDIVVLVVAADDGVMPQTIEAINHARAANVPIIVAVNKIDKPNANPEKVMKELAEHGLIPEEWGGTTLMAKISAKKKTGINELLELILLQAEMLELKANPDKLAKGIIIESGLDKGHGPVGTVIVREGTLSVHDPFVAGTIFGRVRALIDDKGKRIQKAPPATPVLVVGFSDVPQAGDPFIATTEESYARELSRFRQEKIREKEAVAGPKVTLEDLYAKMGESEKLTLNLVLKGDARGTLDAIQDALTRLSTQSIQIQIIHSGVGAITETDVNLAMASGAIIIGFNVKPMAKTQVLADQEHVQIRTYSVIYEMIDEVRKAMEGMLAPKIVEVSIGKAEVRKIFTVSRLGSIAGSYVLEGKVIRSALAKVRRNGNELFSGKLASLKRFKDDVKEVQAGYECGLALEGFNDIREGDVIEFFVEEQEKQTLDG
ncbi:MAG TPA: translation initiation factor IF-2 [Syntrophorhabdales bacterium]|nr:translation initiation factor IF-2 [Syntrophorhabdales bacterium]